MRLGALFNGILEHEMLDQTIALYTIANDTDNATIEEAIANYIVAFEVSMKNIESQLLE